MSTKIETKPDGISGYTKLVSWMIVSIILAIEVSYVAYWVFGAWIPVWVAAVFAAGASLYTFAEKGTDAARPGFVVRLLSTAYLALWIMHYVPSVAWPLVGGAR